MCVCVCVECDNVFWQSLFSYWKKKNGCQYFQLLTLFSPMATWAQSNSLSQWFWGSPGIPSHWTKLSHLPTHRTSHSDQNTIFWLAADSGETHGLRQGSRGSLGKKNQGPATKSRVNEHRIGKNGTKICDEIRDFMKKSFCFTAEINTTL